MRIDYPIMDEGTGITVLEVLDPVAPPPFQGNKFNMDTLMPICLPKNKG